MPYWLIKTEPSEYSFADLVRDKKTTWSGVSNPLAKKHLKSMAKGDEVLVYHTGKEKTVVGVGKVLKADEKNGEPILTAEWQLARPVTLAEIKKDERFKDWALVKIGRLSVVPTTPEQFAAILAMAE